MATEVTTKRKGEDLSSIHVGGRGSGPVVLDEDEWTDRIEAIIERDYFPDIPKMQNKLEWLQAVRSRDPELLRQAQLNIAQRRAGMRTPIGASPATFATPGLTSLRAPASLLRTPAAAQTPRTDGDIPSGRDEAAEPVGISDAAEAVAGVSLDRFMAKHTSEDNASFNEIIEASNKRRLLAKPWLFEDKNKVPLLTDADRANDGFGTTGQPHDRLLMWPYQNKNTLYYDSSEQKAVALSDAERSQQVQGAPKQINRSGTRFASTAERGDAPSSSEPSTPAAARSAGDSYSVVATPSFTPGVEESPFITWGELEGTPLRLDAEDDIVVQPASGPQFRVPEASSRDALARQLGQTAAAKLRNRAASARRAAPPLTPGAMPPPTSGLRRKPDGTPSGIPLSSAGRKLAQSLHGRAAAADAELRASYSASPARPAAGATPGRSELRRSVTPSRTPVPGRSAAGELQSATPGSAASKGSLTDDLLNI